MALTPENASDSLIDRLFEGEIDRCKAMAKAMDRIDEIMHKRQMPSTARAFDLHSTYTSFAPESERWTCVDLNTYDGAPDAEAPCNFIGRGSSEKSARMDLLDQFSEYDGYVPRPRVSTVVHSSPFEPAEYTDEVRDESED